MTFSFRYHVCTRDFTEDEWDEQHDRWDESQSGIYLPKLP